MFSAINHWVCADSVIDYTEFSDTFLWLTLGIFILYKLINTKPSFSAMLLIKDTFSLWSTVLQTTNARDRGQLSWNVRNTYCVPHCAENTYCLPHCEKYILCATLCRKYLKLRLKTEPVRAGLDATAKVWLFFLYTVLVYKPHC